MASRLIIFLVSFFALTLSPGLHAEPSSEQLYYELDRTFPKKEWQTNLNFVYDFNNPYAHLLGGQLGVRRHVSPFVSLGLVGDVFFRVEKQAAQVISNQLNRHNETLLVNKPQFLGAFEVKLIPFIGYVNFADNIWNAEIGPILRAGVSKYEGYDTNLLFGAGLGIDIESRSGFGFHCSIIGDWDKVGDDYLSRIGIRMGPAVKF